jgi:carbonic anhydrase
VGPGVDMPRPSTDEALTRLVEGNQRFVRGAARREPFRTKTLAALRLARRPYATALRCGDSRVPPGRVFDAGVEELCDSLTRCPDAAEEDGASCR